MSMEMLFPYLEETVLCNGAIRRSLRRLQLRWQPQRLCMKWRRLQYVWPRLWATSVQAPWSTSTWRTQGSTSWSSTQGCRWERRHGMHSLWLQTQPPWHQSHGTHCLVGYALTCHLPSLLPHPLAPPACPSHLLRPFSLLQVEHPCTEMVADVNLPALQLQVAMGLKLHRIKDIRRMYKEDLWGDSPINYETWVAMEIP